MPKPYKPDVANNVEGKVSDGQPRAERGYDCFLPKSETDTSYSRVIFEVFTAVTMKNVVF
jgi:hypothetical protein